MEDYRGKFQNYEAMEAADSAWREAGRGMDKQSAELTALRTENEALRGLVRFLAEAHGVTADGDMLWSDAAEDHISAPVGESEAMTEAMFAAFKRATEGE